MYRSYLRSKMKRAIHYCSLVMHSITHVTFFLNRLLLVFRCVAGFDAVFYKLVLMYINHVLTGNKADEQQPGVYDM